MKDWQSIIGDLDPITKLVLAVTASGSGIYTYLGARTLLDGGALHVLACLIYAISVSAIIWLFWIYALSVVPRLVGFARFTTALMITVGGTIAVIAMSSWLNAAALAGSAALKLHADLALAGYREVLDQSHRGILAGRDLLSDLEIDVQRLRALQGREDFSGALTGFTGQGVVTTTLGQTADRLKLLANDVRVRLDQADLLREEAAAKLASMRQVMATNAPISVRIARFSDLALDVDALVSKLLATSPRAQLKRTSVNLLNEIVPPAIVAIGTLASRQESSVENIKATIQVSLDKLARAADEMIDLNSDIRPARFEPLYPVTAVFRYAADFAPSWAGAVAVDVMPFAIILFLAVAFGALRHEADAYAQACSERSPVNCDAAHPCAASRAARGKP